MMMMMNNPWRPLLLWSLVLLASTAGCFAFVPVPILGRGGGNNSHQDRPSRPITANNNNNKNGAAVAASGDLSKTTSVSSAAAAAAESLSSSSSSSLSSSSTSTSSGEEDEDGWKEMRKEKRPAIWRRTLKQLLAQPVVRVGRGRSNQKVPHVEPGTLILVRHGESLWNANKTFTGWADPDLSERGFREVQHAARLLLEGGYEIDVVFTSRLKRAIRSSWVVLKEMNQVYLPVFKSWRLNERMYGGLTGLGKSETAVQLGATKVQEWRGSLHSRPPALQKTDAYWPGRERKYADLSPEQIPLTESLKDCMDRTQPVWENKIMYELRQGKNVLVVAHANTLRGLVKTIDDISDENIKQVAIPTGIPIVYKFEPNTMKSVPPSGDRQTASQLHMKGLFLEKPGLLKEALQLEEQWKQQVPGYDKSMISRDSAPLSSLELSLNKLRAYRQLGEWAEQFVDPDAVVEDDGNDGNMGRPIQLVSPPNVNINDGDDSAAVKKRTTTGPLNVGNFISSAKPNGAAMSADDDDSFPYSNMISATNQPCVKPIPEGAVSEETSTTKNGRDPVIVIIRHGKTEHNKLKLFTGWEDAPLAKEGIEEAREAGRLLKKHGFEFDVVYTSWLSRAIETAWLVIDELDSLWLPIIKTWRLNERMYGRLTGLSKMMVQQRHGDEQFRAWRRGFNTPPPPVSSFSPHYPGNDPRYQKYLTDVRYSVRESIIRSIEKGKIQLHRKLPKSESLEDCMKRTIPFFTTRIVPEAIDQGKRVLISSSENAIRGLLMHLCDIPEEEITGLEIPNGLPIIFDIKSKCVKLLDDGSGVDPLEKHNFGKAANYLFKPCKNNDGTPDEECDVRFVGEGFELNENEQATINEIFGQRLTTV